MINNSGCVLLTDCQFITEFVYNCMFCLLFFRLRSPVGKMTAKEQRLEGELRYVSSRITTNGLVKINSTMYYFSIFLKLHVCIASVLVLAILLVHGCIGS